MDLLGALLRLTALEGLPRTGWVQAGVRSPESVADHSLGTGWVALALGPREEPPLNVDRAVALALVHDAPEALLGDLSRTGAELVGEEAKARAEDRAARRLLEPLSGPAADRWAELRDLETREARFVALCDRLPLGVRLVDYRRAGQRGLEEFLEGIEGLDCAEFPACEELRRAILRALEAS